jgi:hypothetical protein
VGRKTAANHFLKIVLEYCEMTSTAPVGYLAASLVFATFCTKRMVRLRTIAIASNIAFIGYGYLGELWPILILHAALLPMNMYRLRQAVLLEQPDDTVRRRRIASRRRQSVTYDLFSCAERKDAAKVSASAT